MWQEPSAIEPPKATMTDVVFRIDCAKLPVDHATSLANAICEIAPLIDECSSAGIHPVHVAGSQNGWERPDRVDEFLLLSKRTRLRIRVNVELASTLISLLSGVTLDVSGSPMHILSGQSRTLFSTSTLYCRYAFFEALDNTENESMFLQSIIDQCEQMNFSPTKVLCGKQHRVSTNNGQRLTRSVLFAEVPAEQSLTLQQTGLGDGRTMGCGLLIPYKDTGAVNQSGAIEPH